MSVMGFEHLVFNSEKFVIEMLRSIADDYGEDNKDIQTRIDFACLILETGSSFPTTTTNK